jgi:hypothetical protein
MADVRASSYEDPGPVKPAAPYPIGPPPAAAPRPRWLLPAAAAGLVLLGAAVALAVALPVTLTNRPLRGRGYEPLDVAGPAAAATRPGVDRTYFLAADPVEWDFVPSGSNLCKGAPFTEDQALYVTAGAGRKFKKALFREYTDGTFTVGGSRSGGSGGKRGSCGVGSARAPQRGQQWGDRDRDLDRPPRRRRRRPPRPSGCRQ